MMKKTTKQISIVLETPEEFSELEFLKEIRRFINEYPEIKIIGTHIKLHDNERK